VAVQQSAPQAVSRPARSVRSESRELWTILPALDESVTDGRHLFAAWLDTLAWPAKQRDDIVLAVNEALTNAIEHAYPPGTTGEAQLYAWEAVDPERGRRRVIVVVTDHGRWKPAVVDRGHRGHGMAIMARCMDSVNVEPSPGGTAVVMTSTPVAARAGRKAA
jgi:serine/threonine-protein kinase RsbW